MPKIETWGGYDQAGIWTLHVHKRRGTLTLDEIRKACIDYEQGFYLLVIKAMDCDMSQYYETEDLTGDHAQLYRADDFLSWRERKDK